MAAPPPGSGCCASFRAFIDAVFSALDPETRAVIEQLALFVNMNGDASEATLAANASVAIFLRSVFVGPSLLTR